MLPSASSGSTGDPQGRHQGCRSSRRFHHARRAPCHTDRLFREPPGLRRTATAFDRQDLGAERKDMPAHARNCDEQAPVQISLYGGFRLLAGCAQTGKFHVEHARCTNHCGTTGPLPLFADALPCSSRGQISVKTVPSRFLRRIRSFSFACPQGPLESIGDSL